ncbi:MAG: di-heme oxidoredictase family protein [Pseudomonadota bacterium]
MSTGLAGLGTSRRGTSSLRSKAVALALLLLACVPGAGADEPPWSERVLVDPLPWSRLDGLEPEVLLARGEILFRGRFTTADGAGRPLATQAIVPTERRRPAEHRMQRLAGPDAASCAGCHHDPVVGGAGDFASNAFVSEGFTSADFDNLDPQFSNERITPHLFGSGLIELLAREMTADLQAQRRSALVEARTKGESVRVPLASKGVDFGRLTAHPDGRVDLDGVEGIDADLVLRPFGHKGVFPSLRHFTVTALNAHHGIQPSERFGARWTGTDDFDGDAVIDEIGPADVTALVAFQAGLAPPTRLQPEDPRWRTAARQGEALFDAFGCASCHRPSLPLETLVFAEPGPFNPAGTLRRGDVAEPWRLDLAVLDWAETLRRDADGRVLVPLFSDLKRHVIADVQVDTLGNETLAQRFVERDVFKTRPLWGVASTAPYGHRGDLSTLDEVIRAHGGDARPAQRAYTAASEAERQSLIAFLRTLVIP